MSRYAVVENDEVVNVVEWDGESGWSPPDGTEAVVIPEGERVGIGWGHTTRDGFIEPPPPDPGTLPEPEPTDLDRIYALAERLGVTAEEVEQDATTRIRD